LENGRPQTLPANAPPTPPDSCGKPERERHTLQARWVASLGRSQTANESTLGRTIYSPASAMEKRFRGVTLHPSQRTKFTPSLRQHVPDVRRDKSGRSNA